MRTTLANGQRPKACPLSQLGSMFVSGHLFSYPDVYFETKTHNSSSNARIADGIIIGNGLQAKCCAEAQPDHK